MKASATTKQRAITQIKNFKGFKSIHELRDKVESSGSHFFDTNTMKFFNSRVLETLYHNRVFITSEKYSTEPRRYTVRSCDYDCDINVVGEFFNALSKSEAIYIAKNLNSVMINIIDMLHEYYNTGKYYKQINSYISKHSTDYEMVKELDLTSEFIINRYESAEVA